MRPVRESLLALALAALCGGCGLLEEYGRRRHADLLDAFPASVGLGYGLSASARATPLLQVGLGVSPVISSRYGYVDRRLYGAWDEYEAAFPWSIWKPGVPERPAHAPGWAPLPLAYRWQVRYSEEVGNERTKWEPVLRPWGRVPPAGRESDGALLFPPATLRELVYRDLAEREGPGRFESLRAPAAATLWEVERSGGSLPRTWDLFEVDVFVLIVGARLGVRPVEVFDLLVGVVGLDPLGDDAPPPLPTPRPEPSPAPEPPVVDPGVAAPAPPPTRPDPAPIEPPADAEDTAPDPQPLPVGDDPRGAGSGA